MKFFLLFLITSFSLNAFCQKDSVRIPIDRQYFHDKIIEEQNFTDKADGKLDGILTISKDEVVNQQLTDALFRQVNSLRLAVETDTTLKTRNDKVRHLRYIEEVLKQYRVAWLAKKINPLQLPSLLNNFEAIDKAFITGQKILPIINAVPYEIARINADVFYDNNEGQNIKDIVYLKYLRLHPDKILSTIRPYVNESFADSLITEAAKLNPINLYTYAQNKFSPEGTLIHQSKDSVVQMVSTLSQMPTALNYFPFLDELLHGNLKISDIEKYVGTDDRNYDSLGYFKLLVKTEIDYAARLRKKDTPIAMFGVNGLRAVLENRANRHFIKPINDLHERPTPIRMKAIQALTAEELYYVMIMGENDIYTSSYVHCYERLVQLMPGKFEGDSLLLHVNFDYFKKFIKMAANYNKLDDFLGSMPDKNSGVLMRAFVANLDQGENLEDAVDVADAYSSIVDTKLRSSILNYVEGNQQKAVTNQNKRGQVIYGLLKTIFESANSSGDTDLTAQIGIPSIYEVSNNSLKDDKGRIVQQVFFYGDEDGKTFFPGFVNSFSAAEWAITNKAEWVEIKSRKGNVIIFANKPLDSDKNLDDSAQVHLETYYKSLDMHPSIVVHRGHSYWLPGTIERMPEKAKLVILGSCGGYKNLSEILEISPDAHIISTKETGAGDINRPILNYVNQTLIAGKSLEWRPMWANLTNYFSIAANKGLKESWDDYVPPYKNLGAIFIKGYNKQMGDGSATAEN